MAEIWENFLYWKRKFTTDESAMARSYTPKVVTANALVEGDVIYLTADDRWSRRHEEA